MHMNKNLFTLLRAYMIYFLFEFSDYISLLKCTFFWLSPREFQSS